MASVHSACAKDDAKGFRRTGEQLTGDALHGEQVAFTEANMKYAGTAKY